MPMVAFVSARMPPEPAVRVRGSPFAAKTPAGAPSPEVRVTAPAPSSVRLLMVWLAMMRLVVALFGAVRPVLEVTPAVTAAIMSTESSPGSSGRRILPVSRVMKPVPEPPVISPSRSGRIGMVSEPAPPPPWVPGTTYTVETTFTLPAPEPPRPLPVMSPESCPPWLPNVATLMTVGPDEPDAAAMSWIVLAPLPNPRTLILSVDPALFASITSVPPERFSVPGDTFTPRRFDLFVPTLSSVSVPPVFTLYVTAVKTVDGKPAPAPLYVSPPPFTVTPPFDPGVEVRLSFCTLVIVSVPVPIFTRLRAAGAESLKRLIWPENVLLVLSKPTVRVGIALTVVFVTMPLPASEPSTVFWPLRFKREVAVERFNWENRDPALPTPSCTVPACTFNGPVKTSCAFN